MAKQLVRKGDTSRIEYLFLQNSSLTTGAGLTGLVFNSAGLTAYYVRTQGSATAITLVTQTVTGAFSSGGFVEIDATNMPGVYRLDIPDAVFATGVDKAVLLLKGATNMAPVALEYQLVDFDPEDAAGLGLSRVDAAITTRATPAQVNTEVDTALADINLDHLVKLAVETDFPTTVHLDSVIGHLADNGTTATFTRTTDSLEAMRDKETDIETDTQDIQTRLPAALVGSRMDANVSAFAGVTQGATNIDRSTRAIVLGTVGVGSTTTSIVTSSLDPAATVADQFKGLRVAFDRSTTTAALRGQATDVISNTSGGTLTVTALTTAPVSGDTFVLT